jgi:5-methylcytosine-specific restriction enzyme subunit McrC
MRQADRGERALNPRYLTAFEHQRIPVGGAGPGLTLLEADYLTHLGKLRPGFCTRGHNSVRLAQFCGVIRLGDRILEVLPKIDPYSSPEESRAVLLHMLRAAPQFPYFQHLTAGQRVQQAPLLDVFISAFFDTAAGIARGGLLRQYREHQDDLTAVRDRIVESRQFAVHANRPDRIACRYDELTIDNTWNRLIRAGLRVVRPWLMSLELNRRWVELMGVFDEISDVTFTARTLNSLAFDRHAERYRAVTDWVRWILAALSPSLRAGEKTAPGLLFDMNSLFQAAVASMLRGLVDDQVTRVEFQDTSHHLASVRGTAKRRAFRLKPDLVVRRGNAVSLIADTKWKRLDVSRSGYLVPRHEDMYQMQAYAAGYRAERLALIYPWHSGLAGSRETVFDLPAMGELRPSVRVACIDIHRPFAEARGAQDIPELGVLLDGSAWHPEPVRSKAAHR